MIEFNRYSGNNYLTTGNVKQSNDNTFVKCGNVWVDNQGTVIEETKTQFNNLTTGINSTFGDPFAEVK